jgi:hypothetical protein
MEHQRARVNTLTSGNLPIFKMHSSESSMTKKTLFIMVMMSYQICQAFALQLLIGIPIDLPIAELRD